MARRDIWSCDLCGRDKPYGQLYALSNEKEKIKLFERITTDHRQHICHTCVAAVAEFKTSLDMKAVEGKQG